MAIMGVVVGVIMLLWFATGITIAFSASLGVSCVSARIWFLPYSSIQTRFNHVQAGKSCSLENLVFGREAFFLETLKREGYGS